MSTILWCMVGVGSFVVLYMGAQMSFIREHISAIYFKLDNIEKRISSWEAVNNENKK